MKRHIIWSVLSSLVPTRKRPQTQANTVQADTQRPPDDTVAWLKYWEERGQPWRTEPEIDKSRQQELAQRCTITPDVVQGIYPFKGLKLSRADIEWLLATHDNGRGPIDWKDESQRSRIGLDIRGADLSRQNLSHLPLACLCGGVTREQWLLSKELRKKAFVVNLEGANLSNAHLQRSSQRLDPVTK